MKINKEEVIQDLASKTPELFWDKYKKELFPGGVPKSVDRLMQGGLNNCSKESDKWDCINEFLGAYSMILDLEIKIREDG